MNKLLLMIFYIPCAGTIRYMGNHLQFSDQECLQLYMLVDNNSNKQALLFLNVVHSQLLLK